MLAGKIAGVAPYIDRSTRASGGRVRQGHRDDVPVDLHDVHRGRAWTGTFHGDADQTKMMLGNMRDAELRLPEALNEPSRRTIPRERCATPDMIDKMDPDKALAFYKDRFADANDFTFVFVGEFRSRDAAALAERVLASLPSIGRKGNIQGPQRPHAVDSRRAEGREGPRASRATRASSSPDPSSTTSNSAFSFALSPQCSRRGCGRSCAKTSAERTACRLRPATRRCRTRNTAS